jgi:hypothetical protein
MARYLQNKDKFQKYRVVADYNKDTNDYPRDVNGMLDESFDDIHIRCNKGNQIYSYGRGVLVAYVPSIKRGGNILRDLSANIAYDIERTDTETLFKFKVKDLDEVATLLKAHINQKDKDGNYNYISCFSVKNLPKCKVKIPDDKLDVYKELTGKLGINSMLIIKDINNQFIKSLTNKSCTCDDIKADMKLKGAKGKDYFYLIGRFDDYLGFLEERVNSYDK